MIIDYIVSMHGKGQATNSVTDRTLTVLSVVKLNSEPNCFSGMDFPHILLYSKKGNTPFLLKSCCVLAQQTTGGVTCVT